MSFVVARLALVRAALLGLAGAPLGCLVEGTGSKTLDAVISATAAGAVTVADEVARERAARDAARSAEHYDGCPAWQCYAGTDMTLEDARGYALAFLNHARSDVGLGPLTLDYSLNAFAQMSSKQLARDHRPHGYFAEDPGACPLCAESQGDAGGVAPAPVHDQLEAALGLMLNEGAGGPNHDVLLGGKWHRLGVGIVNPDGPMYFTIDVAP
jgi:hypothetical protein